MEISVNNEPVQTAAVTLEGLMAQLLGDATAGVAVAVGSRIVPRGQWASTRLSEGMSVVVIRATQGG